jgi:transcriptional regulator with XRE-family HTH domain
MPDSKKDELKAFANRLETLLLNQGKSLSPTALARSFNLRWRGIPVTVNATRKWLMGMAMPTLDKLTVLANMLNTSEDWLRWGSASARSSAPQTFAHHEKFVQSELRNAEQSFAQDFRLLNSTNKKVVSALMEILLSEQQSSSFQEKSPTHPDKSAQT